MFPVHTGEQSAHLLAGEDGRKRVVIFCMNLRKNLPVTVAEMLDKEDFGRGNGLPHCLWLPMPLEFDVEEVIAQMRFGERGGIAVKVLMNQPDIPVIGMPGAIGIEAQREPLREPRNGIIRMIVVNGIDKLPPGYGTNHRAWSNI